MGINSYLRNPRLLKSHATCRHCLCGHADVIPLDKKFVVRCRWCGEGIDALFATAKEAFEAWDKKNGRN